MSGAYSVVGDWGTTRMRLFRVLDSKVVDRVDGPGIGALTGSPADTLLTALAPWRRDTDPMHVVLCGMAGARAGLVEAPYADCPVDARGWAGRASRITVDGIPIAVAAGLACERADATPDVMRGEETQIFGALHLKPTLAVGSRLIALPGTHGKWALLRDGGVVEFQTFLSGELFALLRDHSTLTRVGDDPDGEDAGFEAGLARARQSTGLLGSLFPARSAQLRSGRSRGWALGYLSGVIIGYEVEEMLARMTAACPITLIGDPALTARYGRALQAHAITADVQDGDACALAGLRLFEETISWK
jgi:2-dehydro-3-deoxygalactonokinase